MLIKLSKFNLMNINCPFCVQYTVVPGNLNTENSKTSEILTEIRRTNRLEFSGGHCKCVREKN